MTIKKMVMTSILTILVIIVTQNMVYADSANTELTIEITEPKLYIESVTPPTFETYSYARKENTVNPVTDLSIKVIDERDVKTPWQLNYQVALFEKSNEATLGQFRFLKGKLLTNGQEIDSRLYESGDFNRQQGSKDESTILTVSGGTYSQYEYRVDKNNIFLCVPAQSEIGHYYSKEIVTLISVPSSE